MENKINIAELLKDCPKGMGLDCTMYDRVTFDEVITVTGFDDKKRVKILLSTHYSDGTKDEINLTEFGTYTDDETAKCVIFPKGKTTWEGFVPPCQFKDGDILAYTSSYTTVFIYRNKDNEPKHTTSFYVGYTIGASYCNFHIYDKSTLIALNGDCDTRFATEEEKIKLFQAIKDNGYKWNAETKTLEKLPKFKVGARIVERNPISNSWIVASVSSEYYGLKLSNGSESIGVLPVSDQDNWELVPNKFDINTLKPFESSVLIRTENSDIWEGDIFVRYDRNATVNKFHCIGGWYEKCIPFKGNEWLLGTTNDCSNYYKTWKE